MYSVEEEEYCDDDEELVFEILCNDPQGLQQSKISQDSLESSHHLEDVKNSRKRKRVLSRNKKEEISDELKLKKIKHRDMERQRRRGMTALYSSLRSILPLEYVRGKRSVSDHMHEAANYIKQVQTNMKELVRRRDNLNKENGGSSGSSSVIISQDCVTVSQCHAGVEILINSRGESLPISRVLHELMKQGLDVVSYTSSQVEHNSLHTIQSQASDMKCINLHALQRRVIDVINNY